jgi:acyl-CoA reductase-like NAD-dependent aldehyde dehydrogenase
LPSAAVASSAAGGYTPTMTKLLDQALRAVAELPEAEQDALAAAILAEVKGDESWDRQFSESATHLERLADEAIVEHRQGRSQPLDPDAL